MRRVVLLALVVAGLVPASAQAWTWPVGGRVLRPFVFGSDPYAGGQHRGIDVAGDLGTDVLAPASGTVSFAGTVPKGGKTLSIRTPDGYTVSLQHLGSMRVRKGDPVTEGSPVATVGTSGEPAWPQPYVYLGIRVTADEQGYVDPQTLLPVRTRRSRWCSVRLRGGAGGGPGWLDRPRPAGDGPSAFSAAGRDARSGASACAGSARGRARVSTTCGPTGDPGSHGGPDRIDGGRVRPRFRSRLALAPLDSPTGSSSRRHRPASTEDQRGTRGHAGGL
jgi:hypothetical protein